MDKIKKRYGINEPDPAIPQQKRILKSADPEQFLNKASKILQCDIQRMKKSARISEADKLIVIFCFTGYGRMASLQIYRLETY